MIFYNKKCRIREKIGDKKWVVSILLAIHFFIWSFDIHDHGRVVSILLASQLFNME